MARTVKRSGWGRGWGRVGLPNKNLMVHMNALGYCSPLISQRPPSPFLRWQQNSFRCLCWVSAAHSSSGRVHPMVEWNPLMNQISELVDGYSPCHGYRLLRSTQIRQPQHTPFWTGGYLQTYVHSTIIRQNLKSNSTCQLKDKWINSSGNNKWCLMYQSYSLKKGGRSWQLLQQGWILRT